MTVVALNAAPCSINQESRTFDIDLTKCKTNDVASVNTLVEKIHKSFDFTKAKSVVTALLVGMLATSLILGAVLILKDFHVIQISSSHLNALYGKSVYVGIGTMVTIMAKFAHRHAEKREKKQLLNKLEEILKLNNTSIDQKFKLNYNLAKSGRLDYKLRIIAKDFINTISLKADEAK